MSKRYKPCRHSGTRVNKSCGDCARTCALGLGTNGTCRITHELQKCESYERKLGNQFSLPQVNDGADLERRVVGDDHELKVEFLGQGQHEVADPGAVALPGGGEFERLVEDE
jgi:hypothetical protein